MPLSLGKLFFLMLECLLFGLLVGFLLFFGEGWFIISLGSLDLFIFFGRMVKIAVHSLAAEALFVEFADLAVFVEVHKRAFLLLAGTPLEESTHFLAVHILNYSFINSKTLPIISNLADAANPPSKVIYKAN